MCIVDGCFQFLAPTERHVYSSASAPAGRHVYRIVVRPIPALQRSAMCIMFHQCRPHQKHISDYTGHQSALIIQDIPL